ncbi:BadF/BadG/BcrA/BcrD ATPase family protein [Fictibacillus terranigra]|uniref:BadF/BadG/BcrA/BcrD ATPase family protein n=1 Tax=Fictibacillus terranigra TaxID=3058424 RepID=A0ABT8EDI5_9BACL|nr:BadF/BadG/BcrA/BcrD ATPase family protein [Fictibacillus sp. CENA-BCM004]MDN4075986.1 BadF/BadG/BcrA/BcrD ATPase family protein [Fictibacillus sp. CENA-BCM004]
MSLVLGVDGGGTKTRAVVVDEKGNVIGSGMNGPSDYDAVGMEQAKENLQVAVVQACDSLSSTSELDAVYLGLAGVVSSRDIQVVQAMLEGIDISPKTIVKISHDCSTALAGGTGGKPGIVLISGTGSSCFGRNANGEECLAGCWGYLFADVGSGYYLGHQALTAILNAYDGTGETTALTQPVLEALKVNHMMEVMHRIYHPRIDISGIAALAPIVTELAGQDNVAKSIIVNGCKGLVKVVGSVVNKLEFKEDFPIVPVGGLASSDSIFSKNLFKMLKEAYPTANISKPLASPLAGAGILALQELGLKVNEETFIKMGKEINRIF